MPIINFSHSIFSPKNPISKLQEVDDNRWNILHYACKSKNLNMIEYIVSLNLNSITKNSEKFLHITCLNGDFESTEYLMSKFKFDLIICMLFWQF